MAKTEKENRSGSEKKPGIFKRMARYFKELRGEVSRVVWPSRKQIINNTSIVIVVVIIASLCVSGIDLVLQAVVNLILSGSVSG